MKASDDNACDKSGYRRRRVVLARVAYDCDYGHDGARCNGRATGPLETIERGLVVDGRMMVPG